MIPGLWLEPEVAGKHSALAEKPDSWFFLRHGRRVVKNSRLLLDFRNPEVRSYLDAVVERLVKEYGVGYIKMDYNTDTLEGTGLNADSLGQGLLDHNRVVLSWLDGLLDRYPELVIENCGSGGGRMDYGMLSHTPTPVLHRSGRISPSSGHRDRFIRRSCSLPARRLVLSASRGRCRSGELQHGVGHAAAHPSERASGPSRCACRAAGKGRHLRL